MNPLYINESRGLEILKFNFCGTLEIPEEHFKRGKTTMRKGHVIMNEVDLEVIN